LVSAASRIYSPSGSSAVVGKLKNSVIDTRKVASTAGLMFFRGEGKAVGVDVLLAEGIHRGIAKGNTSGGDITIGTSIFTTNTGDTLVMFVVLNLAEIISITNVKAIVSIELEKTSNERIASRTKNSSCVSICGIFSRIIEPTVISSSRSSSRVDGRNVIPDKFLNGVVEVKGNVLSSRTSSNGLGTSKLNLLDEVFVADLGKTTTFISIKIDVIYPELAITATRSKAGSCWSQC